MTAPAPPDLPPPTDGGARIVETHTALVFFVGDHAYKLKKPVDLGFFDHRTREARLHACQQEVALNRRLAPDVYLGVLDVTGEDGQPIDHLVDMRRLPDDRRLARCIERGEDVGGPLRTVARAVAGLHEASGPDPHHDRLGSVDATWLRWIDGFDQLRPVALPHRVRRHLDRTEHLVTRYLAGRRPLFDQRIADGRIRDGHGDLQAEDIFLLDDGPRILDCIEFGDDYRWGDVLADVAFLAMDLERLGRIDLAQDFLALHRELTADRWPATFAHHHVAFRAHVRAKVGILRASQHDQPLGPDVEQLVDLSLDHLEQAQVQLILVGGPPGTGKSTLAAGLGDRLGAVVLRSDEVRSRVELGATERYAPEAVTAVYLELLLEARRLLGLGEHVILDATWGSALHRDLARHAARETSSSFVQLACTLPPEAAAARVARRRAEGTDLSEATPDVAAALADRFEPWPEATALSTRDRPATVLDRALLAVRDRPRPGGDQHAPGTAAS